MCVATKLVAVLVLWFGIPMLTLSQESPTTVPWNATFEILGKSYGSPSSWTFPLEMHQELRYYLAGYDYEKRPVIICEFGKWDARKFLEKSEESKVLLYKYMKKVWYIVETIKSPFNDASEGVTYILDTKHFSYSQLSSFEVMKFHLWAAREADRVASHFGDSIMINVDFITQAWINIIRPVAGEWLAKTVTIGTNDAKIRAELGKRIPKDQLPLQYGGSNLDYHPVSNLTSFI